MNQEETYVLIEKHFREHQSRLVKALSHSIGNYHHAEEVVQEAYTRACAYWESFNDDFPFNEWFGGILNNCIRNKLKDEQHHGMADDGMDEVVAPQVLNKIHLDDVKKYIAEQPDRVKHILTLFFISQYTIRMITQVVKDNENTVKQVIKNFRMRLRDMFKEVFV